MTEEQWLERNRANRKRRRLTDRLEINRKVREYMQASPLARFKRIARNATRKLVKQPCEVCGEKAQAHHDDYTKPLEVRWLCKKHHLMADGGQL